MLILIGRNDTPYLGAGWYPVQTGPAGIPCRWISQRAAISIPADETAALLASPAHPSGDLFLTLTVSAPALIMGHAPGLSLYCNSQFKGHVPDLGEEGQWTTIIYSFAPPQAPVLDITFAVETYATEPPTPLAFVPAKAIPGNNDLRELGVLISSFYLS